MASFFSPLLPPRPGSAEAFRRRLAANPAVLETMRTGTGPTGLLSNDSRGYSNLLNDYRAFRDEERASMNQAPLQVRTPIRQAGPSGGVGVLSGGDPPRRSTGGSGMPSSLSALSKLSGGGFDPTDDPRVQQALIMDALAELDYDPTRAPRGTRVDRNFARGLDQQRQEASLDDQMANLYEPREAGRRLRLTREFGVPQAQAEAAVGDVRSEAEAGRSFLPNRSFLDARDFERRKELTLGPAQTAAQSRLGVAELTGQSRVGAAEATAAGRQKSLEELLALLTKAGVFGTDPKTYEPNPPPDDLRQRAIDDLLRRAQGGGQAPTGAPGPAAGGGLSPDIEALIADGIAQGLARDRNDAITQLRQRGIIR